MKHKKIFLKGVDKTKKILNLKVVGGKYEVTFNNNKVFRYNPSNVEIIESALSAPKSQDCFDYLKCIASEIGLTAKINSKKTINILEQVYSKIDFVMPDSILSSFLSGKLPEPKINDKRVVIDKIYPFGFNASQKEAVDKALVNNISVIEGPPGTGKTQTILNIIANAVMNGESVVVVSSNNSAIKNIQDKLSAYDVGFISAYLGNSENKNNFIEDQQPLPDMGEWKLKPDELATEFKDLKLRYKNLETKLAQKNELSLLKQELSSVKTEEKYFLDYAVSSEYTLESKLLQAVSTSDRALKLWLLCELHEKRLNSGRLVNLIIDSLNYLRFWNRDKYILRKLFKDFSRDELISNFQRIFYESKVLELSNRISILSEELSLFDFNNKMSEYSQVSAKIFKASLAKKYINNNRDLYEMRDLWSKSKDFVEDYPVILSTTYSVRSSLSNSVVYDYVIVDESSQVDICTGALALSCARKAVVVGDVKQLPNVVDSKTAITTDAIFDEYHLPEFYRYKNHSLLTSITEMFPDISKTFLKEHYRCHPKIIEFCNKKFYDNQLIVLTDAESDCEPLVLYKTLEGNHQRTRMNQRQIDVIKSEIIPQQNLSVSNGSLSIITPYRNQTHALQEAFEGTEVRADTVDKFQGQESEIVILSTVDNEISDFTDNANRLNVAVSRAVKQLIVVVSGKDIKKDSNIGELVRFIEYNNFSIVESKVYSVFDYLYKSYWKRRKIFLAKYRRISKYDSENLMSALITEVLKGERFKCFDFAAHVPFRMIVRDTSLMTSSEMKYATNSLTHVDFLIFESMGKLPVLAIEVDGVSFHAKGTRQYERDLMKDEILGKYSLPILRLKTDCSFEEERLVKVLEAILREDLGSTSNSGASRLQIE